MYYVEVLLPLPLERPIYSYLSEKSVEVGKLCRVPFGKGKIYTGVVISVGDDVSSQEKGEGQKKSQKGYQLKYLLDVLPLKPIERHTLDVWKWVSEYFMCWYGEVLRAALPSGVENYSSERLTKEVWRLNPRLFSEEVFRVSVNDALGMKKTAIHFIDELTTNPENVQILSRKFDSLKEMEEGFGISSYTLMALRQVEAIQRVQEVDNERIDSIVSPTSTTEERSFSFDLWNGKDILVLHFQNSRVEQRVPLDLLDEVLKHCLGIQLLLFPNLETLKLLEPHLRSRFRDVLYPYYSAITSDRVKERSWTAALNGNPGIYYGLRSAVWLPFKSIDMVTVVDEEDRGYRQYEPAPRFTASYIALMWAKKVGAHVLLTTASPSVETALRGILSGKYMYKEVRSPESYTPMISQKVKVVDMETAFRNNEVQARLFSPQLSRIVTASLDSGGSVLLFYQRQGFAKYVACSSCNEVITCPVCHTTLRYYGRGKNNLVCPACGHYEPLPPFCPYCGTSSLTPVGTGVERLEKAVRRYFPGVEIDSRTMETEYRPLKSRAITFCASYDPRVGMLREADVVGIVQWDLMEYRPDFRATELSYRFIQKVVSETKWDTPIVIQYMKPYGYSLKALLGGSYKTFLDSELESRRMVGFSPFSRQMDVVAQSQLPEEAYKVVVTLSKEFVMSFPSVRVLGPSPLSASRKESKIGYRLTLLIPLDQPLSGLRDYLWQWKNEVLRQHRGGHLFIYFDVDPQ